MKYANILKTRLANVKHQFNVDLMEKDTSDTRIVHFWVNELQQGEFDLVLVYKQQGTFC